MSATTEAIRVYSGGAARRVVEALTPAFERATGFRIAPTFEIVSQIQARLDAGDLPDLILLPNELLTDSGKRVPFSPEDRILLARVGIGVIVRNGAPQPDLSDEAGVRRALREAKAVALADPRTPTGRYLNAMLERLSLLDELRDRLIHKGAVHGGAGQVASGAADLGLYLVSEVQQIEGVRIAGLLPPMLQNHVVYGAAVPASSRACDAALSFVRFLKQPDNAPCWTRCGFEPIESCDSEYQPISI